MTQDKSAVLNEWVKIYTKDLLTWCNFKINNSDDAEDIVQNTFISAFENFDSFKGNSMPRTWLYKILNNKIIDYYRKKAKTDNLKSPLDQAIAEGLNDSLFNENGSWNMSSFNSSWGESENILDNPEFRDILLFCLDDLPENWKTAVMSKYILSRNTNEVCQDLNISSSNYWQILHRSKLLLKICLENNWFNK